MHNEPLAHAVTQARDRADALSADLMRLLTQHAARMSREVADEIIDAANLSSYAGQCLRRLAADLWPQGEPRGPRTTSVIAFVDAHCDTTAALLRSDT